MSTFFGYFIWGLILAAPVAWLAWRVKLPHWMPRGLSLWRRRAVHLPPQLRGLVILGKPQRQRTEGRR